MDMNELVSPESIVADLKIGSKKKLLHDLSERLAKITRLPAENIFRTLVARERLGTTGVGEGVAIPHGKIAGLNSLYGFFARLAEPVEFDSTDGAPVDLVFLLLAPEEASVDHVKALARISRTLRDKETRTKLRCAKGVKELYAVLVGQD